jgi:hypothetical protein
MTFKITDMCRFVSQPGSLVRGTRYRYWFTTRLSENPDDTVEWCLEEFGIMSERWRHVSPDEVMTNNTRWYNFYFRDQSDAFLFKVRWC